jgi:hypothetical protein
MSDKRIASPHEEYRPKTEENAMRPGHYIMTSSDVYRYAAAVLERHLRWHDYGPKCTVNTLLQVLLYAAAQLCSVFAACCRLCGAPAIRRSAIPWSARFADCTM